MENNLTVCEASVSVEDKKYLVDNGVLLVFK